MAMRRAGKSGDAAANDRKLEERYDAEMKLGLQPAIRDWINATLKGEDGFVEMSSVEWRDVAEYFGNGAVLCRFMNKLLLAAQMDKISFKANPKNNFAAMSNIEDFNKAAEKYGIRDTFQTTDLVDGRKSGLVNVFNCLNQLGFAANSKNFQPSYSPPAAPKNE